MAGALSDLLNGSYLSCQQCGGEDLSLVVTPDLRTLCPVCSENIYQEEKTDSMTEHLPQPRSFSFINNLTELAKLKKCSDKKCDYCSYEKCSVPAAMFCLECWDYMCDECKTAHNKTKVTRHHRLISLVDLELGKYDLDIRKLQSLSCRFHDESSISALCRTCGELICQQCLIGDHIGHKFENVESTGVSSAEEITKLTSAVKNKQPSLEQYIQTLDEYSTGIQEQRTNMQSAIDQQAQTLHDVIDECKQCLSETLKKSCDSEQQRVKSIMDGVKGQMSEINQSVIFAERVVQFGNPAEVTEVEKYINDAMLPLLYQGTEMLQSQLTTTFDPDTTNIAETVKNLFGHLSISQAKGPAFSATRTSGVGTMLPSVHREPQLVSSFTTDLQDDSKDTWPSGVAIDDENNYLVVDRDNKRIKVFDKDGSFVKYLDGQTNQDRLDQPYDLAVLDDGSIAVTDYGSECVKIIDSDNGVCLKKISSGIKYPRGITSVSDGNLAVIDCYNRKVLIFGPDHKMLKEIHSTDKNKSFTDPYYITTNSDGNIIITDWAEPSIQIFSPEGESLTKYGNYGVGEDKVLQPYGVCTDTFGYIFVADNQNHRIHMLAPDGCFLRFLLTEKQSLWYPMALAINKDGHLVITEALGKVKIYKYL